MERDLRYVYQGLKDAAKDAERVEDQLCVSIHQGASNLHSDEDLEDEIKLLNQRVQTLIRTYKVTYPQKPTVRSCSRWNSS